MAVKTFTGSVRIEQRGDSDWLRIRLTAGEFYQLQTSAGANVFAQLLNLDGSPVYIWNAFTNTLSFTVPTTGDYFVALTSDTPGTIINVTVTSFDDVIAGSTATTSTIAVGQTLAITNSNNLNATQQDWFAADLVAGQSYQVTTPIATTAAFLDANGLFAGDAAHFTPATSGRYYVAVAPGAQSSYTVALASVADDRPDLISAAGTFAVGSPATGTFETRGDLDLFAITLAADTSYRFALTTTANQSTVSVRDASGNVLWTSPSSSGVFTANTAGTYYVGALLSASSATSTSTGYTLAATQVGDVPSNSSSVAAIDVNGTAIGATWNAPGDIDWFRVSLTQGQSYSFVLTNNSPQFDQLFTFNVVNDTGGVLARGGLTGTGGAVTFTAAATGTFFISTSSSFSGTYSIGATSYTDDFADNVSTTGRLTVGGSVGGQTEVDGESDWFAVDLVANRTYLLGGSANALFNAAGVSLANSFGFGDLTYTPATSGTYYVSAGAGLVGTYTASITQISDDFVDNASTRGQLLQQFQGTSGNDTINGSEGGDQITGLAGDDILNGFGGNDILSGGDGNDTLDGGDGDDVLQGGNNDDTLIGGLGIDFITPGSGNDIVSGGDGDDAINYASFLTAADRVDGGAGTNDQVAIQGSYTGANALVLTSAMLTNVEVLALLPGGSYNITTDDSLVSAGQTFRIFAGNSGSPFTLNGAAETDGNLLVYGGTGTDLITTGAGNDGIYFGPGRFNPANDRVNGGAGNGDQLALDGNYTITLDGTAVSNIEVLALLRGVTGSLGNYNITFTDAQIGAGQSLTVWALPVETALTIDASVETDGSLTVFGGSGNDVIRTGGGNDTLFGGAGADTLTGGAGANIFRYTATAESTTAARDTLVGFAAADRIELTQIDADGNAGNGDTAFTFIGAGAFTNVAGQLRVIAQGADWLVEGDVNGDGVADLSILVQGAQPLESQFAL